MSVEQVKQYLAQWEREGDVLEMEMSTATVELAAQALGVIPARIAKTISLEWREKILLVVTAGDARIDNRGFKDRFSTKPRMLAPDKAQEMTGHPVGGVCPFALPERVQVYLDESLRRFETVFPACGSANSAIEMTMEQLYICSRAAGWVDVCKGWRQEETAG